MAINAREILDKMNPNQKINYDRVLQKMIQQWQRQNERPKILLHSCCAPCSTYTLEYLTQYADVTIYFENSNIHPREEYLRREQVQKEFITAFNHDYEQNVQFMAAPYEPQLWVKAVKGLEKEKEGGLRCSACFDFRFERIAKKAKAEGFDYFGSTLTISPHKNSQVINDIGLEVQALYDVQYLPSDFKKNNGYRRSVEMCDHYHIYRQCYCGCLYAAKDQGVDLKEIKRSAQAYLDEHAPIQWNIETKDHE